MTIDGDDYGATVHGMTTLMAVEFCIAVVPFLLAILLFKDAPPSPPSHSTNLKIEVSLQYVVRHCL